MVRVGTRNCWGWGKAQEHTSNILLMSVTVDVSKFSDWLNADAPCQESRGRNAVRGGWCGAACQRAREGSTGV